MMNTHLLEGKEYKTNRNSKKSNLSNNNVQQRNMYGQKNKERQIEHVNDKIADDCQVQKKVYEARVPRKNNKG